MHPNALRQLKLTPNGFYLPKSVCESLTCLYGKDGREYYGSPYITTAFVRYLNNNKIIEDFDFMDELVKYCTYLQLPRFLDTTPYVKYKSKSDHVNFIKDTNNQIQFGYRDVSIDTWVSMLRVKGAYNAEFNFSKDMLNPYGLSCKPEYHLASKIGNWIAGVNGPKDLLMSMYLLVGLNDKIYNFNGG